MAAPPLPETLADDIAELRTCLRDSSALAKSRQHARALTLIAATLTKHRPADKMSLVNDLLALQDAVRKQRRALLDRSLVLGMVLISLIVVGFMQLTRVGSADVVVDVKTRGVFLTLGENGSLHVASLEAVLVSSLAEVVVYSSEIRSVPRDSTGRTLALRGVQVNANPHLPVVIRASSQSVPQISLSGSNLGPARLDLRSGAPIEIRPDSGPGRSVTVRQGATATATVGTGTTVAVECIDCEIVQSTTVLGSGGARLTIAPLPREVQVLGRADSTDVAFVLAGDADSGMTDRSLRVTTIDFTSSDRGTVESLVQEATVRIADLDDMAIAVGERGFLDIGGIDDLVISRLILGPTITMRLEGRVGSIRTGAGRTLHSRMPTRLEWAAANKPLELFAVGVSAVFGFLAVSAARLGIGRTD